jgi:hypothetical protein
MKDYRPIIDDGIVMPTRNVFLRHFIRLIRARRQLAAHNDLLLVMIRWAVFADNVFPQRLPTLVRNDGARLCVPKIRFGVDAASGRRKLAS